MARALDPLPLPEGERWLLAAIARAALHLTAPTAGLARRQRLVSDYGARFDMEIDAFAVLVACDYCRQSAAVTVVGARDRRHALSCSLPPRWCAGAGDGLTASDSGFAEWRRKTSGSLSIWLLIASPMPAMPSASARFACALAFSPAHLLVRAADAYCSAPGTRSSALPGPPGSPLPPRSMPAIGALRRGEPVCSTGATTRCWRSPPNSSTTTIWRGCAQSRTGRCASC